MLKDYTIPKETQSSRFRAKFCILLTHQSWKSGIIPYSFLLKRPSILCDSYWHRFESINLKSHFNRSQNELVAIILFRVISFHFFSMSIMKSGAENPTDALFNLRTGIYTKDISKPPQRPSLNICSLILQTDVSSIIIPSWYSVLLQHSILPPHIKIIWPKFLPCSLIQTRYSIMINGKKSCSLIS